MATKIKNIYGDLKYGYEKLANGDFSKCYDENSINQSLMTLLLTKRGERFFNPSYGTNIYKYLYEPFDKTTADDLLNEISTAIEFWEGRRLNITDININMDFNTLTYNLTVTYNIKSTPLVGTFNLNLQKA
jgi:phage baseplate assembly protein W